MGPLTEWAADDHAVAGDSQRALSLAAALVSVAKMGVNHQSAYLLSSLYSPLVAEDEDLAVRVDRLLREQQYAEKPLAPLVQVARNVALVAGGLVIAALVWPGSLGSVHQILKSSSSSSSKQFSRRVIPSRPSEHFTSCHPERTPSQAGGQPRDLQLAPTGTRIAFRAFHVVSSRADPE